MIRSIIAACFLVVLGVFAGACSEQMEAISQITKFRVMGVQAEPPEIRPGEGTTLSVLFADPAGEGRDVTVLWFTCTGSISPTADISEEGCEPIWAPLIGKASDGADTYRIPFTDENILDKLIENEDAGADKEDAGPDEAILPVTTIVVLCAGGALPSFDDDAFSGDIEGFDELCQDGDGLVAVKTFKISNSDMPNRNPVINRVVFEESPVQIDERDNSLDAGASDAGSSDADAPDSPGMDAGIPLFECEDSYGCREGAEIQAFLTQDSFQSYVDFEFGKRVEPDPQEDPYISWFITGGKFSDDRSRTKEAPGPFMVDWIPPRDGGTFQMWAVAHDMRGGTSWRTFSLSAQVPKD